MFVCVCVCVFPLFRNAASHVCSQTSYSAYVLKQLIFLSFDLSMDSARSLLVTEQYHFKHEVWPQHRKCEEVVR